MGPKDYLATGESGWPERFQRSECDAALRIFFGAMPVAELVANFNEEQRLARSQKRRHETLWGDVTGYLTRVMGGSKHSMTPTVVIGFWALSILAEREASSKAN